MKPKIKKINNYITLVSLGGVDSNFYLLGSRMIVDTTTGLHKKALVYAFKQLDITEVDITTVILTHEHFDHIGGLELFRNAKVLASEQTAKVLESADEKTSYAMFFNGKIPSRKTAARLKDKDIVRMGDTVIEIIHTPGHSEGSICLYIKKDKILISGDTVFADSIGRVDLLGGDEKEMIESLEKLEDLEIEMILPGHGEIVEKDGTKHIKNILDNLKSI